MPVVRCSVAWHRWEQPGVAAFGVVPTAAIPRPPVRLSLVSKTPLVLTFPETICCLVYCPPTSCLFIITFACCFCCCCCLIFFVFRRRSFLDAEQWYWKAISAKELSPPDRGLYKADNNQPKTKSMKSVVFICFVSVYVCLHVCAGCSLHVDCVRCG